MDNVTPLLLSCGLVCVFPALAFFLGYWLRGSGLRLRVTRDGQPGHLTRKGDQTRFSAGR